MIKAIKQVLKATRHSLSGLQYAFTSEFAFQIELFLTILIIPFAFFLDVSPLSRAMMVASWLLVLISELVNTAIELIVDRISEEPHHLSKRAKDVGSAVVFMACVNFVVVWLVIFVN